MKYKDYQKYRRYLKSYDWQIHRQRALKAAGYRCQVCNSEVDLEAHHRTYDNLYDEQPGDLSILCAKCHGIFSERLPKPPFKFLEWLGWRIEGIP